MRCFRPLDYLYGLAIPLLLMLPLPSSGSASDCVPRASFTSQYVKAYSEIRKTTLSWCVSNFTGAKKGEVHVVFMNTSSDGPPGSNPIDVDIIVKPYQSKGKFRSPFVFVLSSDQPVNWRVQTMKIRGSPKTRKFVIPRDNGTTLTFDSHGTARNTNASRVMPRRLDVLPRWVHDAYGGITSLAVVRRTDAITVSVGIHSIIQFQSRCDIQTTNGVSPFIKSYRRHLLPLPGCCLQTSAISNSKAVHILELDASGGAAAGAAARSDRGWITVDVTPVPRLALADPHVVLILKSTPRSVSWRIRSRRVSGKVEIRGSGHVNAKEVNTDPMEIVNEHFTKSGRALIRSVEHSYGPVVSYTRLSPQTRFIKLFIDEGPTYKRKEQPQVYYPNVRPSQAQSSGLTAFTNPAETQAAISRAMTVTCLPHSIHLSLPQSLMQYYKIKEQNVYMGTDACRATSNGTHLVILSPYSRCNTVHVRRHGLHYLSNFLIVTSTIWNGEEDDRDDDDDADSALGSGADAVSGSGMLGDGREDDEDYPLRKTLKIEFECRKPIDERRHPSFRMTAYSGGYHTKLSPPARVGIKQRVYFLIQTDFDAGIYPQLHGLWLSSSPHNTSSRSRTLIRHGCIEDDSVRFDKVSSHSRRYEKIYVSFVIGRFFLASYVHADLSRCVLHKQRQLAQCMDPKKFCENELGSSSNSGHVTSSSVVTLGPFTRVNRLNQSSHVSYETHEEIKAPEKNKGVIIMQGLDSGTVIGITFAAFTIGVLLTSVLWCIHKRTSPWRKREVTHPRWGDGSEETTPCSTAPIAAHT